MNKIFIPIKAESQRVPGKNFRDFHGKPLWKHTLDKFTDYEVFVDTDDKQLFETINEIYPNIIAYLRDEENIGHNISVNSLLYDFATNYCEPTDIVAQVHVTSPFLKPWTVDFAFDYFNLIGFNADSVTSATKIQARCWRAEPIKNNESFERYIPINHDPEFLEQTQDINPIYVENSLVYAFRVSNFIATKNRFSGNKYFIDTEFPENLDIDDEEDWKMCVKLGGIL